MRRWLGREPSEREVMVAMICAAVVLVVFIAALVLDDLVQFHH